MTARDRRLLRQTLEAWRDAGVTEPDGSLTMLAQALATLAVPPSAGPDERREAVGHPSTRPGTDPGPGNARPPEQAAVRARPHEGGDDEMASRRTPAGTAPGPAGATRAAGSAMFASGEVADFGDWAGDPLPPDQREIVLKTMAADVAGCPRCEELARCRNKTVFGEGTITPRLVFMGEAPGADEDATGRPFVGRAGQLLTDIIEKGMKLRRQDVYILNTIKCRPPGNRNPTPEEAANCEPFLDGQLEVLRPEYICCLGAVAAQNLLKTKLAVGKLRGRLIPYRQAKVLVTYHPSYLLRSPNMKAECWKDIQVLMAAMGLPGGKSA